MACTLSDGGRSVSVLPRRRHASYLDEIADFAPKHGDQANQRSQAETLGWRVNDSRELGNADCAVIQFAEAAVERTRGGETMLFHQMAEMPRHVMPEDYFCHFNAPVL
jgi:hypothetical protein